MGIISGIKNTFKKSEAAVVVQNLLEHQSGAGLFDGDPARSATLLVEAAWQTRPDVFDGKFGQRPHKLSVAAIAFANAVQRSRPDNPNRDAFGLCLGMLLSEAESNGSFYPLTSMDHHLLSDAAAVFSALALEMEDDPLCADIGSFLSS